MISGVESPSILPLRFRFLVRPVGRLMLVGNVPSLAPFRALPLDAFLWMRWGAADLPAQGGANGRAFLELAASASCAEGASNARVIARTALANPGDAWPVYLVAEVQGVVDLWLTGSDAPVGSPEAFLHLLASVAPSGHFGESVPVPGLSAPHRRARSSSALAQTPISA